MTDAPDFQLTVLLNFTPGPLMPGPDAPDWEVTAQLVNSPQNDAPDWQRYIVGPGGVPIRPGPPHVLPAIIQEASAFTTQDAIGPLHITATLAANPVVGNQLVAILAQNIDASGSHWGAIPAPGPPAGWTCLGSVPGANPNFPANSILITAYSHAVQTGDGKSWSLPIHAATAAWMAALALYEVTPSGPVGCAATCSAAGFGTGLIGQEVVPTSDALGSLGIMAGCCSATAGTAHAVTIDAVHILPAATWTADLDVYDPSATLYNNLGTFTAPFIPPADTCALALDTQAVNAQNQQAAGLMLLFPAP
jgi:hypothetical protein